MNVAALITKLKTLPQDMDVYLPVGLGSGVKLDGVEVCYFDPKTEELCEDKELMLSPDKAVKVVTFGSSAESDDC